MRPYQVALQMYSLRERVQEKGILHVLKEVADIGYAGVEFAGLAGETPEKLRETCNELGLIVTSLHGPFPSEDNLDQLAAECKALGCKWRVSGKGRGDFETVDACITTGKAFAHASELMASKGLGFGVHNHEWEFQNRIDGRIRHEIALERAPDTIAQIDTYWVAVGGENPADVIRSYGDRTPLLHIKDGPMNREEPMTAVGDGKMDWEPIFEAADSVGSEWAIVEIDRCATDMLEAVARSFTFLVNKGYGRGR